MLTLFKLNFPVKESCLILLQTIPGNIDMENFERTLVTKFPQIVSYHDLHIWQLSSHNYIATVHIIFQSPKLYAKTIDDVRSHFHDHSIAHVTIQPEFYSENTINTSMECLMQCSKPECVDKVCCKDSMTDLREISVCPGGSDHEHGDKKSSDKIKKHSDHHGHSHNHGHEHKHGHSHEHKHDHTKSQSTSTQQVPKALEEKSLKPSKTEATKNNAALQNDTESSSMPLKALELKDTKSLETSKESSVKPKPLDKTETSDLSQIKTSELSTTVPSAKSVDDEQTTSVNAKY